MRYLSLFIIIKMSLCSSIYAEGISLPSFSLDDDDVITLPSFSLDDNVTDLPSFELEAVKLADQTIGAFESFSENPDGCPNYKDLDYKMEAPTISIEKIDGKYHIVMETRSYCSDSKIGENTDENDFLANICGIVDSTRSVSTDTLDYSNEKIKEMINRYNNFGPLSMKWLSNSFYHKLKGRKDEYPSNYKFSVEEFMNTISPDKFTPATDKEEKIEKEQQAIRDKEKKHFIENMSEYVQ